ncbi:hypothetical protein J6590_066968 [Homalodisca vitripennis]|nr:hypothetical protein J6590_066968 [Homalodisca vitripennis]
MIDPPERPAPALHYSILVGSARTFLNAGCKALREQVHDRYGLVTNKTLYYLETAVPCNSRWSVHRSGQTWLRADLIRSLLGCHIV